MHAVAGRARADMLQEKVKMRKRAEKEELLFAATVAILYILAPV